MKRWSFRQGFALILMVFVTLGLGLSVVQASQMEMRMAAASEMGVPGHGDCNRCDLANPAKTQAMLCTAACVTPVLSPLPQFEPAVITSVAVTLLPPKADLLSGSTYPPEPHPPRSGVIG